MVGNDSHLGLTRGYQARTVGADELHPRVLNEGAGPHHVVERDALGDAHDQADAGGGRLHDGVGGEGRRHEDAADVGAGLPPGIDHGVEDRDAELRAAPLAGADAGDEVGSIGLHLLGVKAPLASRQTLDQDATVF